MSFVSFRSLATQEAVQYLGEPIPGVTCDGDVGKHGCDSSRATLPHVHTAATGGMTCLKYGDFISPQAGGPFVAIPDTVFRAYFEVKTTTPVDPAIAKAKAEHDHPVVGKPAVAATHEERTYADGTTASGTAPLPDFSPSGAATLTVKQVPAVPITAPHAAAPAPAVHASPGVPVESGVHAAPAKLPPVVPPVAPKPGVPAPAAPAPKAAPAPEKK